MMTAWQRLRRLWSEPRIRLPDPGLSPEDLHPGDRLQIGSQLWQIAARQNAARQNDDPAMTFELTTAEGSPGQARLQVIAGRWTLTTGAGTGLERVKLDPAGLIHFAVALGDDWDRPI